MIASDVIASAFAAAFAREERLTVSQWADRHARLKTDDGDTIDWSTSRTPYLREIMDAAQDTSLREVTFKKCEQVGGTEAIQRILQEVVDQRPRRVLYVYPNQKVAAKQVRLKLMPALKRTPRTLERMRVATQMGAARANQSAMLLIFDRCEVILAGSNSLADVEGFSSGFVVIDELDRCVETIIERVRGRGAALAESLLLAISTPSGAGQGIDERFQQSDRRRYHVPCPHCGRYDHRRLDDLRWPGRKADNSYSQRSRDLHADPGVVEAHARIVCKGCDRLIGPEHNMWQLRLGVWVPDGCTIGPLRRERGVEAAPAWTGTPRTASHRGYELTGLYRCLPDGVNPYGEIARGFVAANGNPDIDWWNRRMGLAWSPRGERADIVTLKEACKAGEYVMGSAPAWMVAAVAAVDVQPNHAYVEVLGLGRGDDPEGQRCGLLLWEVVQCPSGLGLAPVEAVLRRTFPRERREGEEAPGILRISGGPMDSGHRKDEVYQWARQGGLRVACKGVGGGVGGRGTMSELVRWSSPDQDSRGRPLPGGVRLLLVNTWAWKQAAIAQLMQVGVARRQASIGPMALAGTMRLSLPKDTPAQWLAQVTSEQLVTIRRGGRSVSQWVLRPGARDNHALDCHVYALAYCHAMGAHALRMRPAGAVSGAGSRRRGSLLPPGDRPIPS